VKKGNKLCGQAPAHFTIQVIHETRLYHAYLDKSRLYNYGDVGVDYCLN
jgi:hypothetical protein